MLIYLKSFPTALNNTVTRTLNLHTGEASNRLAFERRDKDINTGTSRKSTEISGWTARLIVRGTQPPNCLLGQNERYRQHLCGHLLVTIRPTTNRHNGNATKTSKSLAETPLGKQRFFNYVATRNHHDRAEQGTHPSKREARHGMVSEIDRWCVIDSGRPS